MPIRCCWARMSMPRCLSVRRDVSQMHKVHEAQERMESVGIRVLGAVVNGITETSRRPAYALPSPV